MFTGGEPLLQLTRRWSGPATRPGSEIAVETNGTIPPPGIDWLTVSPKPGSTLVVTRGQELKLVYPHDVDPRTSRASPSRCSTCSRSTAPGARESTASRWTTAGATRAGGSAQTHKLLGIP